MGVIDGFYCSCGQYIDYDENDTLSVTIRDKGKQNHLGNSAVLMCPKCSRVYVVPVAKLVYDLGEVLEIQLKNGMIANFEVIGLNHDELAVNPDRKASYTLCLKGLLPEPLRFFSGDKLELSWKDSYIREWLNTKFVDLFPDSIRKRMQVVKKLTLGQPLAGTAETHDRIFLLSPEEVFGTGMPPSFPSLLKQYPLFTDPKHRMKFTLINGMLEPVNWWLRSMSGRTGPNGPLPNCIGSTGELGYSAGQTEFIAPCFCLS